MISVYCEKMDKVDSIYRYILTGYYVGFMANGVILPCCNKYGIFSELKDEVKLIKVSYDIVNTYRIYEPNKKYSTSEYIDSVVDKIDNYFISGINMPDVISLTNNIKMDMYELTALVVSMYFGANRDRYNIPNQFMDVLGDISCNESYSSEFIDELYYFRSEYADNLQIETLSVCMKCLCELFSKKFKNSLIDNGTIVDGIDKVLYNIFNIHKFSECDMERLNNVANDVYLYIVNSNSNVV